MKMTHSDQLHSGDSLIERKLLIKRNHEILRGVKEAHTAAQANSVSTRCNQQSTCKTGPSRCSLHAQPTSHRPEQRKGGDGPL